MNIAMQSIHDACHRTVRTNVLIRLFLVRYENFGWPRLLRSPQRPKERIVKRLIGIEGDWLMAKGHEDIIRVPEVRANVVKLPKDPVTSRTNHCSCRVLCRVSCRVAFTPAPNNTSPVQGHCWIEGDDAGCSVDSASEYGALPLALIEGRVVGVCWPRLQSVQSHIPRGKVLMRSTDNRAVDAL